MNSCRRVMIREFGGELVPFDSAELQTRLAGCFAAAGRQESADLPQDIVLAVEATLRNAPRKELIFGRGEVECAVIRLLEEIGFPEVAALCRAGGTSEALLLVTPERRTLAELLNGHIAAAGSFFDRIIDSVAEAAQKLGFERVSAHLLLELARHYERELAKEDLRHAVAHTPEVTLSSAAIREIVPQEARNLIDSGVLQIDGVTTLFPCVRFNFSLVKIVRQAELDLPVTELELEPVLYTVSPILARAAAVIEEKTGRTLPVILAIPDMFDFIADYAGGERTGSDPLAAELSAVLGSAFPQGVYKLNLG